MSIFGYVWIGMLAAAYLGWTFYVFWLKGSGMSWQEWIEEGGAIEWVITNVVGLFLASMVYFIIHSAGGK